MKCINCGSEMLYISSFNESKCEKGCTETWEDGETYLNDIIYIKRKIKEYKQDNKPTDKLEKDLESLCTIFNNII